MHIIVQAGFTALLAGVATSFPTASGQGQTACRCYPGDDCWPSAYEWATFNDTIGGKLVATVPLAAPCHNDRFAAYDNTTCSALQDGWTSPETHYVDSASVMAPFFANRSCDPFLPRSYRCIIGTYVQYAVNVSSADDVSKSIDFVRKNNIRLVIRNTGHDYNGKSTGAGALGLWMHHLKDISFSSYSDSHYAGNAIKIGAGVQGFEAYKAADARGLQVVGGECPTVGLAGGYTQGGGHSALASKHGLAADQALEWELVTGEGKHVIANRKNNTDLFWALSGGGGGTFGVVLSLKAKAHRDTPVSAMNLTFTSTGIPLDKYYEAISTFHASLPPLVDAGAMSVWYFTNLSFAIAPITAPEITVDELKGYLAPFENKLNELKIPYTSTYKQFSTYLDEFSTMFAPIDVGIAQYGGRLIPRSVVENNNEALTGAYRYINEHGGQFIGVALNVSHARAGDVYNSVNPGWRDCLIDTVITTPWNFTAPLSEMEANQVTMTDVFIPKLAELTPNGSCYLNEGDFRQPDFKSVFYGENYERLNCIKDRYDPDHIFYATTAVGSDYWAETADGRLCKAASGYESYRHWWM
ncbi:FAD/FMN-containing isoamyl alcohol oxidase MreA [Polychaeton citri CBS 116435]|uniref:FAD/FMN-containing isoamyl alcohol oxidase MreA n=1 Tax=Polychaeton citri CBS 116435 TaxID=1314669 RepID=A0A9P4QH22_9PEZI|nr:FAD/FMN-containing isoamyl alcohol oxidase MreA [Polychaeton citri CBS 116435]